MLIRNKTLAAVWKWIVAVAAFFAVALHGRFAMQGTILISNILLHYVVPICTVIDWLVFDEKGWFSVRTALLWLLAPLGYFVFVMNAVALGAQLGPYGARYPYFFLDVDELGFWTVFLTGMIMELCFFLLGLFWVWLDRWLAKRNEEKHA